MAGIVGVDPGPYTLREMLWMVRGRLRAEWAQTSTLCAVIYNSAPSFGSRKTMMKPNAFDPYATAEREGAGGSGGVAERVTFKQLLDVMNPKRRRRCGATAATVAK